MKTGFLVEDGNKIGTVIGYLRAQAIFAHDPNLKELADYLDGIRAKNYFEYVPSAPAGPIVPSAPAIEVTA